MQLCIHGHDILKYGRNTQRHCRECARIKTAEYRKHPEVIRKPKGRRRFCPKGHDTSVVGRNSNSACRQCEREHQQRRRLDPDYVARERRLNSERMTIRYKNDSEYRSMVIKKGRQQRQNRIIGCPPQPPIGTPCEICDEGKTKLLSADHCHKTGRFRGWLCSPCNTAIGFFRDDPRRCRNAGRYLRQ